MPTATTLTKAAILNHIAMEENHAKALVMALRATKSKPKEIQEQAKDLLRIACRRSYMLLIECGKLENRGILVGNEELQQRFQELLNTYPVEILIPIVKELESQEADGDKHIVVDVTDVNQVAAALRMLLTECRWVTAERLIDQADEQFTEDQGDQWESFWRTVMDNLDVLDPDKEDDSHIGSRTRFQALRIKMGADNEHHHDLQARGCVHRNN